MVYGVKIEARKVVRLTFTEAEKSESTVNQGISGSTKKTRGVLCVVYHPKRPSKGVITCVSVGGMELELGRSKVVQEQGGQSTRRPWLSARVADLVVSPSLTEHCEGTSAIQKPTGLTLTREHGSECVNGKEEHFRDFQGFGHSPIVVPKVQASVNLVTSLKGAEAV